MDYKIRNMAIAGVVAAIYTSISLAFAPISFGMVQLRLAEVLNLFAFINPAYGVGVIIGCLITNILGSPYGMLDVIVGTLSTAIAILCITKTKRLFLASLWPTLFNSSIGFMIWYLDPSPSKPLLILTVLSVMAGQFAVVTCIGVPVIKIILANPKLRQVLYAKS